jgi:hypothetical protein
MGRTPLIKVLLIMMEPLPEIRITIVLWPIVKMLKMIMSMRVPSSLWYQKSLVSIRALHL